MYDNLILTLSNPIIKTSFSPTVLKNSVRSHASAWPDFDSIDQSTRKIQVTSLKNGMFCGCFLSVLIKSDAKFQVDQHKQAQFWAHEYHLKEERKPLKHDKKNRLFILYITYSFSMVLRP
ncbi:hypothetical protein CIPAW_03G052600 [Carya illinoinensis]|uniref:Uncharacterized protein n=1 Tax=Carya illinoinensis TaxID=32201 RepID=A0A8T1QZY0_CARIL|nr:hypothetical protein CIPAW_03G052600 [Carya illinoinensis]